MTEPQSWEAYCADSLRVGLITDLRAELQAHEERIKKLVGLVATWRLWEELHPADLCMLACADELEALLPPRVELKPTD